MSYIGSTPTTQSFIAGTDYFNGNGSTTAFTLSRPVVSVNDIQAVVNNVVQVPNDAYNVSGSTITFTSAPSSGTGNVYVRYMSTTTQSITPSQNTVSYSTLNTDLQSGGYASNFKNRIINGAMVIDQRNAGAAVTVNTFNLYSVDRWYLETGGATGGGIYTAQQSTDAPTGFSNSLLCTVTTTDTSLAAGDLSEFEQRIEGFNVADLGWGTANAQTVTLSFWVKSSVTGPYSFGVQNSGAARSYVATYNINSANTWEYKIITIPGDTTGTWLKTNGTGIQIRWCFSTGSNRIASAANTWESANRIAISSTSNPLMGTLGATFYITGVQLEKGSTATSFDYRPYGTEFALCQRYFHIIRGGGSDSFAAVGVGACSTATVAAIYTSLPATMRTSPSVSYSGSITVDAGPGNVATFSSVSIAYGSTTSTWFSVNTTGNSLTVGRAANIYCGNATTNFVNFSAEL
jgi:hypothetical protein